MPFNFNALHISEEEDAGRLMQRHTGSHNPREALNPGLFAGRDFLDAHGKPAKRFTELEPTPPVLDSEMRYQSATLSPRDA